MTETAKTKAELATEKAKPGKPLVKWAEHVIKYGIHDDAVGHEQAPDSALVSLAYAILDTEKGETDE